MSKTATIFNIQKFCVNDGPGIRTTVFVKGCPLRCQWCHNPESNLATPQFLFHESVCVGCGICIPKCPHGAISIDPAKGKAKTDRSLCVNCGTCCAPEICEHDARELAGKTMTTEEVVKKIADDKIFYATSGGGATFSGGEPLMHADFVAEAMQLCHEQGISTAVETSGFASAENARKVFENCDLILFDIKHMDTEVHKKLTGVGNEQIHANLRMAAKELGKKIWLRLPIIADVNDSPDEILSVHNLSMELKDNIEEIWVLPYHTLGLPKLESLDWSTEVMDKFRTPSEERKQEIIKTLEFGGIPVKIG